MEFPEVDITAEDTVSSAGEKVARAFGERGVSLLAFENLNSLLPTSKFCHFFHAELGDRNGVLVVMAEPWEESSVLGVLNVLLNIRMDPDPPGPPPLFRFYSAEDVPPVLQSLFGDSPASDFECQAALVAHFGNDLVAADSLQFAAVGVQLLRRCLGVRSGFFDPDAEATIGKALAEWFAPEHFPQDGSPLNTVIVLGFLYGENLRARFAYPSRWAMVKETAPWPALVFGPPLDPPPAEEPDAAASGRPQVVFSPLAFVINVFKDGSATLLEEATLSLEGKCREVLDGVAG